MAWLRSSVDRAMAPASGAGPGLEWLRVDYRKWARDLHRPSRVTHRTDVIVAAVAGGMIINKQT